MKIRIWTAITDGGDGEHHSHTYKSKQELVSDLIEGELEADYGDSGYGFDEYGYCVNFDSEIFDIEGYEVIE